MIKVSEANLRDIAQAGYAGAASTNRKANEEALMILVSDQCFRLATEQTAAPDAHAPGFSAISASAQPCTRGQPPSFNGLNA